MTRGVNKILHLLTADRLHLWSNLVERKQKAVLMKLLPRKAVWKPASPCGLSEESQAGLFPVPPSYLVARRFLTWTEFIWKNWNLHNSEGPGLSVMAHVSQFSPGYSRKASLSLGSARAGCRPEKPLVPFFFKSRLVYFGFSKKLVQCKMVQAWGFRHCDKLYYLLAFCPINVFFNLCLTPSFEVSIWGDSYPFFLACCVFYSSHSFCPPWPRPGGFDVQCSHGHPGLGSSYFHFSLNQFWSIWNFQVDVFHFI